MLLVALALAADPSCSGAQPCDGQCISMVEVCPVVSPMAGEARALLTAVPANDLCTATALPRPGEPPVVPAGIRKAANVACTVATFLGPGCDHDAPMLYERPGDVPVQPCGGPPVPPPKTEAGTDGDK